MKRIYTLALAALCAAAPATLHAQTRDRTPAEQRGPRRPGAAGFELLLAHRAELGLSEQQLSRLQGIQSRLQEKNRPLAEQLRAAGIPVQGARQPGQRPTQEERQALRAKLEKNRPA